MGDRLLVVGGCSADAKCKTTVQFYNITAGIWEPEVKTPVVVPAGRGAFSFSPSPNGFVLIGGRSVDGYRNDVFELSADGVRWTRIVTSGVAPKPRAEHSAAPFATNTFVFGGQSASGVLSDLFVLNHVTRSWMQPGKPKGVPAPALAGHSATIIGGLMWVIGGGNDKAMNKDVYVYDLALNSWSTPSIEGTPPSARSGHLAALRDNRYLFVSGGCNRFQRACFNTTSVLDTVALQWVRPADVPRRHGRPGRPR